MKIEKKVKIELSSISRSSGINATRQNQKRDAEVAAKLQNKTDYTNSNL